MYLVSGFPPKCNFWELGKARATQKCDFWEHSSISSICLVSCQLLNSSSHALPYYMHLFSLSRGGVRGGDRSTVLGNEVAYCRSIQPVQNKPFSSVQLFKKIMKKRWYNLYRTSPSVQFSCSRKRWKNVDTTCTEQTLQFSCSRKWL